MEFNEEVEKILKKTNKEKPTKFRDNFVRMFELNRTKGIAKELNFVMENFKINYKMLE